MEKERPLFADLELARRIESTEAWGGLDSTEALSRVRPEMSADAEQIAGGVALFAGSVSPITQMVGMGLSGPVTADHLDQLEAFFRSRDAPIRVEFCPLADPSLLRLLIARHYTLREFSNVLARYLTGNEASEPHRSSAEVRTVQPSEADLWARTVAEGFADQLPMSSDLLRLIASFCERPTTTAFLALIEGEPVGGGALSVHNRVAALYGASTRPAFRRRGVQTALLHAVVRHAAAADCDLAYTVTQPGSISQRAVERIGFRVAYTRLLLVKD